MPIPKPYNHHKNIFGYCPTVIAKIILAIILTSIMTIMGVSAAHAQKAINADRFYVQATKIEKLGLRAPLDPNFRTLLSHAKRSYKIAEIRNNSAQKKGSPLYCRPEDENMSAREVLAQLRKIPKPKRQRMDLTQAFLIIAKRAYPCR